MRWCASTRLPLRPHTHRYPLTHPPPSIGEIPETPLLAEVAPGQQSQDMGCSSIETAWGCSDGVHRTPILPLPLRDVSQAEGTERVPSMLNFSLPSPPTLGPDLDHISTAFYSPFCVHIAKMRGSSACSASP
jgi:hypothetical protein